MAKVCSSSLSTATSRSKCEGARPILGTRFGPHLSAVRIGDDDLEFGSLLRMERTGIEPVASDLQIPGSTVELGQVRLIKAKLCWLGEVEIGYPGTRFGTRFRAPTSRG